MSNTKKIYQELMSGGGFSLAENTTFSDSETRLYALSEEYGKGEYRVFFFKDMFEITIRNFTFNNDFFLECPKQPKSTYRSKKRNLSGNLSQECSYHFNRYNLYAFFLPTTSTK